MDAGIGDIQTVVIVAFGAAAAAAVLVSVGYSTAMYQIKASKLLREGGAGCSVGDGSDDALEFFDRMEDQGNFMLCQKCGTEFDGDHFDFEESQCTNCGYVGMPMITDDTE